MTRFHNRLGEPHETIMDAVRRGEPLTDADLDAVIDGLALWPDFWDGMPGTAGPVPTREEKRQAIRDFIAWNFPPGWGPESGN